MTLFSKKMMRLLFYHNFHKKKSSYVRTHTYVYTRYKSSVSLISTPSSFVQLFIVMKSPSSDDDCSVVVVEESLLFSLFVFRPCGDDLDGVSSILKGSCVMLYAATGGGPHEITGRFLERKLGRDTN